LVLANLLNFPVRAAHNAKWSAYGEPRGGPLGIRIEELYITKPKNLSKRDNASHIDNTLIEKHSGSCIVLPVQGGEAPGGYLQFDVERIGTKPKRTVPVEDYCGIGYSIFCARFSGLAAFCLDSTASFRLQVIFRKEKSHVRS
jgi:hypothetical protein